jgi:hypothetical protein
VSGLTGKVSQVVGVALMGEASLIERFLLDRTGDHAACFTGHDQPCGCCDPVDHRSCVSGGRLARRDATIQRHVQNRQAALKRLRGVRQP